MMYIKEKSEIYLLNRNNNVFQIEGLSFPCKDDITRSLKETLIDGEIVFDIDADEEIHPRYLIYDIISLDGKLVMNNSFSARYRFIQVLFYKNYYF